MSSCIMTENSQGIKNAIFARLRCIKNFPQKMGSFTLLIYGTLILLQKARQE